MLPWAHAAFGYLLYHLYTDWNRTRPAGVPVLALGLGTQLPDLVDKPLAWTFGVLPSGRSFGHSVFTLVAVCAVLYLVLNRSRRRELVAFALGYASHLIGDGLEPVVEGEFAFLGYLFWPLTSAPLEDESMTFIDFFTSLEASAWLLFGLGLTAVGLVVWHRDEYPGITDVLVPAFERWRLDRDR